MSYSYGDCCCPGWYDVYRGTPAMNSYSYLIGRMSNSTEVSDLNWSPLDANPPWSINITGNHIKANAWTTMKTWAVGSGADVETSWQVYQRYDDTGVLIAIDAKDESIHHLYNGLPLTGAFNTYLPRQWSNQPFRNDTTGVITNTQAEFRNYYAGFCMSANYQSTLDLSPYINWNICNGCGSPTELYHYGDDGNEFSDGRTYDSVNRDNAGNVSSSTVPTSRQYNYATFTEDPYPHAASVHNAPKCAGVRTVWNTVPSAGNGGAYDFDIEIVTGELDGTLYGMSVDAVYKTWNYSGSTAGNSKISAMNDEFAVAGSGNTAHNLPQVLGYVEDQDGNKLVYYIPPNATLGSGVSQYLQQESVLEYNGTVIHSDAFNATITHGGSPKTGRWVINAALTDPLASFPDDSGDRAKIIIYYLGSGSDYLQFLDEDLNVLDSQVAQFPGLLTGPSDAYCYSYISGSGPTFTMTRLDCSFSVTFSPEPLAQLLGAGDGSLFEVDAVKRSGIDNLTAPLDESKLI